MERKIADNYNPGRPALGPVLADSRERGRFSTALPWSDRVATAAVLAVVVIAPFPLGSNRPQTWIIWALAVGVLTVLYFTGRAVGSRPLPRILGSIRLEVCLTVALLVWLIVQIVPLGPLAGALAVPTGSGAKLTSATISVASGASLLMLMRMMTFVLLFAIISYISVSLRIANVILRTLLVATVTYAALGLYWLFQDDTILGMQKWAYLGSATSTFVNRNSFATFLSFGLSLGVVQILSEIKKIADISPAGRIQAGLRSNLPIIIAGVLLIVATLFATQSRMGVFAGGVGVLVALIGMGVHTRPPARVLAVGVLFAAIVCGGIALMFAGGLVERLGTVSTAANDRGALYQQVVGMILVRPLLGFGGGTFELAFDLFHAPPVSPNLVWDKAHSSYLTLWCELGIVGGSVPMIIIFLLGCRSVIMVIRRAGRGIEPISALSCLAVAATHSLVDFSLEIEANSLFFVAVLALVPSARIRSNTKRQSK